MARKAIGLQLNGAAVEPTCSLIYLQFNGPAL